MTESYGKNIFCVLGILLLGFAGTSTSASLREARQAAESDEPGVVAGIYAVNGYLRCVSDNSNFSCMAICFMSCTYLPYLTPHMQELNIDPSAVPTVADNLTDSLCSILEYYDEEHSNQTEQNHLGQMMGELVRDACKKVRISVLLYNQ